MAARLIPALLSVPKSDLPALSHVIGSLALAADTDPSGAALLLLTKPNVGLGFAKRGVIVGVNQWYANHLGYLPSEMVGRHIAEFVIGPYEPARPGYHCRVVSLRHKSGHWVRMRCHLYPLVTDCTDHMTVFELD